MATDGPSWADQWGEGGIGAMGDDKTETKKDSDTGKKAGGSGGLGKAKAVATAMKRSTSMGIKWVKNKCQKKGSSAQTTEADKQSDV